MFAPLRFVLPSPSATVPYVSPPPSNVDAALVVMVLDAPLNVRLVVVVNVHVPTFIADAPRVSDLVFELLDVNVLTVTVLAFVSSDPLVSVSVAAVVIFDENIQDPLDPLNVRLPRVLPPLSTVCCVAEVEMNDIADVVDDPSV